jgi:dGTPase
VEVDMKDSFIDVASIEKNFNLDQLVQRESELYSRDDDIRSDFCRDYTRILHCLAYRRLKHKTQVFFNTSNDHICTRMEHVAHVESVSFTIAKYLGLNTELTKAIAAGHDLGHAPFGHQGENVLKEIAKENLQNDFWHEKNGLRFVDKIELLEDNNRNFKNLNLTYAVRDGIVSHCGEIDQHTIFPRKEYFDLNEYKTAAEYQPYTWEGCIVKIADKIAYIGRDIEDAVRLKLIRKNDLYKLARIAMKHKYFTLNTTTIMHNLIIDLCSNSSPDLGLRFSDENFDLLKEIKTFNTDYIYTNPRLDAFKNYSELIIREIFNALLDSYSDQNTLNEIKNAVLFIPSYIKVSLPG